MRDALIDDGNVLVVLNTAGVAAAHTSFGGSDLPVSFAARTVLAPAFPVDDPRRFTVAAVGTVRVAVAPWEGLVLVPEGDLRDLVE